MHDYFYEQVNFYFEEDKISKSMAISIFLTYPHAANNIILFNLYLIGKYHINLSQCLL